MWSKLTVGANFQPTDLLFGFFCFISADCTPVSFNGKSRELQPFDLRFVIVQGHRALQDFLV